MRPRQCQGQGGSQRAQKGFGRGRFGDLPSRASCSGTGVSCQIQGCGRAVQAPGWLLAVPAWPWWPRTELCCHFGHHQTPGLLSGIISHLLSQLLKVSCASFCQHPGEAPGTHSQMCLHSSPGGHGLGRATFVIPGCSFCFQPLSPISGSAPVSCISSSPLKKLQGPGSHWDGGCSHSQGWESVLCLIPGAAHPDPSRDPTARRDQPGGAGGCASRREESRDPGNSPGSAASPWDSALHPAAFPARCNFKGIGAREEAGKHPGSAGDGSRWEREEEKPILSIPSHLLEARGLSRSSGKPSSLMLMVRKEVRALPSTPRSPREGEGALQAPLLPSELARFGTSCRIPPPRAAGMHGQGPQGLQQISSLNQTPPVLISAGTSGLTHRTSSKSSSPPPDPT